MLRLAVVFSVVAGLAATASAGGYVGLALGTAPGISSSDSMMSLQGTGRSGKLLLGLRFGRLSLEGAATRSSLLISSFGYPGDGTELAAALKYSLPLGDNFEAFARGGLQHTSVDTSEAIHDADSAAGNGWLLGGGFEYRINALVAGGSLFVDYEHASTTLTTNEKMSYDASSGVWMAGVTLSL